MDPMPAHFDTDAEDQKLEHLRAEEEEDVTRILSDKYGLPYTDLAIMPVNMDALRVVPEARAVAARAVVFDKNGKHISLALQSPENEDFKTLANELVAAGYLIQQFLVSGASIDLALKKYKDLSLVTESEVGVFDIGVQENDAELKTLEGLRTFLTSALSTKKTSAISAILEAVMESAYLLKASDVHFEPEEVEVRMRMRLDGVLTDVFSFDAHAYRLINSRIKILSGLKLNIADRAQDGRFSIRRNDAEIEVRTSIIPGNYGESVVMRLLDPSAIEHSFEDIGIEPKLLERLRKEIHRPNGMLLTTGPTGSGKTTTLYAFMREIHTPDIKIITIEDPVEYHLPGIVQTQTNGDDYTFSSGLRSVLRQDPDVIMVGEIRDAEVAETAMQAALTGHFVFSTLHTNNAAGAFPRLVDLDVDPKSFASAISVSMGQRLVRTLNPDTRVKRPATDEEKAIMQKIFEDLGDPSYMPASFDEVWAPNPTGPDDTGYKGRTGLHEAIFMDDELGEFLRDNPSARDIEKATRRQGYLTMAQDGVLKALSGITSLEEVFKVVDLPRG